MNMQTMRQLSDRELLILVNQRVEHIERSLNELEGLKLKVHEIETKLKFYAAGISIITSVLASVATYFITQIF